MAITPVSGRVYCPTVEKIGRVRVCESFVLVGEFRALILKLQPFSKSSAATSSGRPSIQSNWPRVFPLERRVLTKYALREPPASRCRKFQNKRCALDAPASHKAGEFEDGDTPSVVVRALKILHGRRVPLTPGIHMRAKHDWRPTGNFRSISKGYRLLRFAARVRLISILFVALRERVAASLPLNYI